MWQQFSEPARQVVWRAQQLAIEKRSPTVEAAHLFLATLPAPDDDDSTIGALLQVSGVTREEAELYALATLETRDEGAPTEPVLSADAKRVIRLAFQISNHAHQNVINPEHLFIACASHQRGPHLGEVLRPLGLDAAQLRQHLERLHQSKTPYKAGNPLNSLTQQSEKVIEAAHAAMRASFCGRISTSHLLLGLLSDENFASVTMLQDIGADLEDLKRRAREGIAHDGHIATPQKKFSPGAKRALERAARQAKAAGHGFIGTDDLLRALLPQRETWREKLKAGGQNFDSVEGLWTAEQVVALQSSPSGVKDQQGGKVSLQAAGKAHWAFVALGFSLGLYASAFLLKTPSSDPITTSWIWITYGISALLASGVGSYSYTKDAWRKIFRGWFGGLMMGTVLFVHL